VFKIYELLSSNDKNTLYIIACYAKEDLTISILTLL